MIIGFKGNDIAKFRDECEKHLRSNARMAKESEMNATLKRDATYHKGRYTAYQAAAEFLHDIKFEAAETK